MRVICLTTYTGHDAGACGFSWARVRMVIICNCVYAYMHICIFACICADALYDALGLYPCPDETVALFFIIYLILLLLRLVLCLLLCNVDIVTPLAVGSHM